MELAFISVRGVQQVVQLKTDQKHMRTHTAAAVSDTKGNKPKPKGAQSTVTQKTRTFSCKIYGQM